MARPNDKVLPIEFVSCDASFSRSMYSLTIPRKFTWEDCLDPDLWRHCGAKFKEGDLVDLLSESGEFDCSLRVVSAFNGGVIFRTLREWHSSAEPVHGEVGESAYVALSVGQGWVCYDKFGYPISRHGSEEDARKALAEIPTAPAAPPAPAPVEGFVS